MLVLLGSYISITAIASYLHTYLLLRGPGGRIGLRVRVPDTSGIDDALSEAVLFTRKIESIGQSIGERFLTFMLLTSVG